MKKIITILLLLVVLTGCNNNGYTNKKYIENKELENEIKNNLDKLDKKDLKDINYEELFKDIESINSKQTPIYAKEKETNKYNGKGYYIKEFQGGEVIEYTFYTSTDKEIYNYKKIVSLEIIDEDFDDETIIDNEE